LVAALQKPFYREDHTPALAGGAREEREGILKNF
jgi:hypothetical protein